MNSKSYLNNFCSVTIYASKRKNARILATVDIRHLIPAHGNDTISDDRILDYFISVLDSVVYKLPKNRDINTRYWISYGHITEYKNVYGDMFEHVTMLKTMSQRDYYSSLEMFINHLYRLFLVIYPYTKLDIQTIYNNPSINYMIRDYYKHR